MDEHKQFVVSVTSSLISDRAKNYLLNKGGGGKTIIQLTRAGR